VSMTREEVKRIKIMRKRAHWTEGLRGESGNIGVRYWSGLQYAKTTSTRLWLYSFILGAIVLDVLRLRDGGGGNGPKGNSLPLVFGGKRRVCPGS